MIAPQVEPLIGSDRPSSDKPSIFRMIPPRMLPPRRPGDASPPLCHYRRLADSEVVGADHFFAWCGKWHRLDSKCCWVGRTVAQNNADAREWMTPDYNGRLRTLEFAERIEH